MTLPHLDWQGLYLDLAWGLVVGAGAIALLDRANAARRARITRAQAAVIAAVCLLSMWLPGQWSVSFWLGMAFQHPSLLLAVLASWAIARSLAIKGAAGTTPLLPALPACSFALLGGVLYASTFSWLPLDAYDFGYAGFSGAIIATLLVLIWSTIDRRTGPLCAAVALVAFIHATTRLPSGNAWDSLIDPLLFIWACVVCVRSGWRRIAQVRLVRGREIAP